MKVNYIFYFLNEFLNLNSISIFSRRTEVISLGPKNVFVCLWRKAEAISV